jgi:hypothetical protein
VASIVCLRTASTSPLALDHWAAETKGGPPAMRYRRAEGDENDPKDITGHDGEA